jgi:hypothetical protein
MLERHDELQRPPLNAAATWTCGVIRHWRLEGVDPRSRRAGELGLRRPAGARRHRAQLLLDDPPRLDALRLDDDPLEREDPPEREDEPPERELAARVPPRDEDPLALRDDPPLRPRAEPLEREPADEARPPERELDDRPELRVEVPRALDERPFARRVERCRPPRSEAGISSFATAEVMRGISFSR